MLKASDLPARIRQNLMSQCRGAGRPRKLIDANALEDWLYADIRRFRLPLPRRQYRFHPSRQWRFDFAWPDRLLAMEVQGGTWIHGGHVRGRQYERDCEKFNAAQLAGWKVLLVTTDMVKKMKALEILRDLLRKE